MKKKVVYLFTFIYFLHLQITLIIKNGKENCDCFMIDDV